MKTAIFGGSFNPIHNGHIQLVNTFTDISGLDRAIIIPAYVSPFKEKDNSVTPEQRLEMCRLAFEGNEKAEISDIEIKRQGASYTYRTLEELSEKYEEDEFFLITGADMFMSVHTWMHPEIIFRLAVICTVPREGESIEALHKQAEYLKEQGAKTKILDISVMTVSSTEIRRKIREGRSISGLVPEAVENYIRKNRLYL